SRRGDRCCASACTSNSPSITRAAARVQNDLVANALHRSRIVIPPLHPPALGAGSTGTRSDPTGAPPYLIVRSDQTINKRKASRDPAADEGRRWPERKKPGTWRHRPGHYRSVVGEALTGWKA